MIKGTTKSGFQYEISEASVNNYELLEAISELEENALLLPKTVKLILGKEQTEQLKDHLRATDMTVPMDKLTEEILEIFNNQSKTKNS